MPPNAASIFSQFEIAKCGDFGVAPLKKRLEAKGQIYPYFPLAGCEGVHLARRNFNAF
jgi:hypothetical protein